MDPKPEHCKAGNAHLAGHFKEARAACAKIKTHLMYSPYHMLSAEEADDYITNALKDGHVMLSEWEYEVDGPQAPMPNLPKPKDGTSSRGKGHAGKGKDSTTRGVMQSIASLMTDVRELQQANVQPRLPIGQRPTGPTGGMTTDVARVAIRPSELMVVVDSIDRAARAARNAERLSSAAAATFSSEASALEQAKSLLQDYARGRQ
jgi:hypothetical protein